jgi:hypothetical protein
MGIVCAVELDSLTIGQQITVIHPDGISWWGQGGTVTALTPQLVITVPGVADHPYERSRFTGELSIEVEAPFPATDCVQFSTDCRGTVDWFDPSGRGRGALRCGHHADERARQYAGSIERYANSDVAPAWLDPSYAGETW